MLIFGDLSEVIESHHLRMQTLLLSSLFLSPPPPSSPHAWNGKRRQLINQVIMFH